MNEYTELKAARVTLLNASKRKDHNWWKLFARYAEIARRKIWWIEVSLLACLILSIGGCGTLTGLQSDIHQVTRPTTMERGQ